MKLPSLPVLDHNPQASAGSAGHECLTRYIARLPFDPDDIADKWGANRDEVGFFVANGIRLWKRIADHFRNPICEQEFAATQNGLTLTGHMDVHAISGDTLLVADYKTGRLDSDPTEQFKGYGWLGLDAYKDCNRVHVIELRVRDLELDGRYQWTREELDQWQEDLASHLADQDTEIAGNHCKWCPRLLDCGNFRGQIRRSVSLLLDTDDIDSRNYMSIRDKIANLVDAKSLLEGLCKRADTIIRTAVENLGPIDFGDGRILAFRDEPRTEIQVAAAWQVLADELGEEQLRGLLGISKTELCNAVKANVGRGQKGKAVNAFLDRLEATPGAVTKSITRKLEVTRNGVINTDREPAAITAGEPAGGNSD